MTTADRADRRSRRELTIVVLLAVLGGALLLLVAGRGWVTLRVDRSAPLPPLRRSVHGSSAQPLLSALGLVGLAGAVALLATRRIGRIAVGVLLCAAGVLAIQRTATDLNGMSGSHVLSLLEDAGPVVGVARGASTSVALHVGWMACAIAAGVLLCAAGLGTIARARQWPVMGRKYERQGSDARPAVRSDRGLWDALDRGDDPTDDDPTDDPTAEPEPADAAAGSKPAPRSGSQRPDAVGDGAGDAAEADGTR